MTKKAFKCRAEVTLHTIRSAGTWLPNRDDLYVTVELLGAVKRSRLLLPIFPAHVNDKLVFERTFWSPVDPQEVLEMLEDLPVSIELRQVTDVYLGGTLLAYYDANARDFLYPQHSRSGLSHDNDILMTRTIDFPGVSPRLEFSTHTVIEELPSSYLDPLGDMNMSSLGRSGGEAWDTSRGRSKNRTNTQSLRPRSSGRSGEPSSPYYARKTLNSVYRSRSPSPSERLRTSSVVRRPRSPAMQRSTSALNMSSDRPPFVVKRVSPRLLARSPTYYDNYYDLRPDEKNDSGVVRDRSQSNTPTGRKRREASDGERQFSKNEKENYFSGDEKEQNATNGKLQSSDVEREIRRSPTAAAGRSRSGSEKLSDAEKTRDGGENGLGNEKSGLNKSRGKASSGQKRKTDLETDEDNEVDNLTSQNAPLSRSLSNLSIRDRYSPVLDSQLERIRRRVDDALWRNRRYPYYPYYSLYYPYYCPPYYTRYPYYRYYDPLWLRSYLY